MGKKQRQRDRMLSGAALASRKPIIQRIPSKHRDPITGIPLEHGSVRIMDRDYDPTRPEGTRYGIPDRLMLTRQVPTKYDGETEAESDTKNSLGHAEWSPAFKRYMYGIKTREQVAERNEWIRWWEVPYVVDRLTEHAQTPNALFTLDTLSFVLAYKRGEDVSTGHPPFWIDRKVKQVTHYVRDHYLPYSHPRKVRKDA